MRLFALLVSLTCLVPRYAGANETLPTCDSLRLWVRAGCPHCEAAEHWVADFEARRAAVNIDVVDIYSDEDALAAFAALNEAAGITRPGVPTFEICGRLVIGFESPDTTGRLVEGLLAGNEPAGDTLELPWLGRVSVSRLGLPAFTLVVGLIDGFNPCATWALLFLLGILVSVRERGRILVVAGTFVAVSGLVYYVFMAAWLNVFLFVGVTRGLQLVLGLVALLLGTLQLADGLNLRLGPSLSIPAAAKPTIYRRVRRIMQAEQLGAAILATAVLAVLVNVVELLCTAGLPAFYTHVLAAQDVTGLTRYAYLALYNAAYVTDDALLVLLAIVTLRPHKLGVVGGRRLKLISGVALAGLGMLLLFAPGLLVA